jgi:hypothetical protein
MPAIAGALLLLPPLLLLLLSVLPPLCCALSAFGDMPYRPSWLPPFHEDLERPDASEFAGQVFWSSDFHIRLTAHPAPCARP